jgi:hypothetical protein
MTPPGDKFLDQLVQRISRLASGAGVRVRQLDVACARDVLRQVPSLGERHIRKTAARNDQRWNADAREQGATIEPKPGIHVLDERTRRGHGATQLGEPSEK